MKTHGMVVLAALLLCAPARAGEPAPPVEEALDAWVEAVESASLERILALYDKKAYMVSAFYNPVITNRDGLRKYYKQVIANPDPEVIVEESHPRRYGAMAINTGRYTLSYLQEGEEVDLPARFSFTYILKDGKWLIVDHHSSKEPHVETELPQPALEEQ